MKKGWRRKRRRRRGGSHWAVSSRQDLYHSACTHTRVHLTYAKRGPRRPPSAQINVTRKQKRSPFPGPCLSSGCRPAQTRTARRTGPASTLQPPPPSGPLPLSKKGQPYFSDVIGTKAHVSACGGLREAATRKVLCGGATELAGFTRAVTKHLLSAVPPRSRLPRARLPLVWHCLFFHRLFSLFSSLPFFFLFGAASSSTGPAPASRSFWYRAPLPYGSSSPLFERPTFRSRLFIPSYYICSPRDVIDTY